MRIVARVKPNAKTPSVICTSDGSYDVRVDAPAIDGRGNARLLQILAGYFDIPPSRMRIVIGVRGRRKIIDMI